MHFDERECNLHRISNKMSRTVRYKINQFLQLLVKLNESEAPFKEVEVQITDLKKLSSLLQVLAEAFNTRYFKETCLYNYTGLQIGEDDIDFIQEGD